MKFDACYCSSLVRTRQTLDEILKYHKNLKIVFKAKGKNILIVAHSGVGRLSYFYFTGTPKDGDYSNFKLDNAKVMKFEN